jgi:hypothetical protein
MAAFGKVEPSKPSPLLTTRQLSLTHSFVRLVRFAVDDFTTAA